MSAENEATSRRLKVLILQHEEPTPPGHVTEWLEAHDADVDTWRIDVDERDVDPRDYDLIVSLGSEFAAFDDTKPFVVKEVGLLRDAAADDVPVLGLCFGGQILARALGGEGFRVEQGEIGWLPVRSEDPELIPEGPWFQWHFDSFTVPAGATVVADTDVGPQAFVAGRSLGLQFHPEVTTEIMDDWVRVYRHELDGDGVDPDGLLEETQRIAKESRERAWQLFERFLHEVAGIDAPHEGDADARAGATA